MDPNLKFKLPDGYDQKRLKHDLSETNAICQERAEEYSFVIFDTFDWRLYNRSYCLYASKNSLFLRKLDRTDTIHHLVIKNPPLFIWDFPDSRLKESLKPILKARALIKLAKVYVRSTRFRILNPYEKTVARLVYEEFRISHKKDAPMLTAYIWLNPVRGYPKYFRKLAQQFDTSGFKASKDDIYFQALAALDKRPGSYSAKINISLNSQMRADEATKIILRFLLQIMKTNMTYIKRDIDSEFLHDLRVAIRRTRSALGQIKNIFPPKTTDRFKKDFAHLGKLSSELRDLDVYLLKEGAYRTMLPEALQDDIDPLFAHLRKKRKKAFNDVKRGLSTRAVNRILLDWEAFLEKDQTDSQGASNAGMPIMILARRRILKKYRSIVKASCNIFQNTDDGAIHVLRIECKKLRYLLEFFTSLFPRSKMNKLIAQLKKVQEDLGYFNDICVQVEYLLKIADELAAIDPQYNKVLMAIGSLIGTLNRKKATIKSALGKTFDKFVSPETNRLFRKLFT